MTDDIFENGGHQHLHWFYGVEEYFNVVDPTHLDKFLELQQAIVLRDKWKIRDLILEEVKLGYGHSSELYVNVILQALLIDDFVIPNHDILQYIQHKIDDEFIDRLTTWSKKWGEVDNLSDHFSRGQMLSKFWLISELNNIDIDPTKIALFGGWYSTVSFFISMNYENLEQIRSFDVDANVVEPAIDFNHIEHKQDKFHAITADVTQIQWNKNIFMYDNDSFTPDILINTSCEHMDDTWFKNIPENTDTVIALQTNDYFENPQHINCVVSIEEALTRYKMREVLFTGELDTGLYKRFMIIGRK